MEATNKAYNFADSLSRIDDILNADNKQYEERKSIPARSSLTHTNGFYVDCTALFVDICDSSKLPQYQNRPVLAKIYRSFISELVALFNGANNCKAIVYGRYLIQPQSQILTVFSTVPLLLTHL